MLGFGFEKLDALTLHALSGFANLGEDVFSNPYGELSVTPTLFPIFDCPSAGSSTMGEFLLFRTAHRIRRASLSNRLARVVRRSCGWP